LKEQKSLFFSFPFDNDTIPSPTSSLGKRIKGKGKEEEVLGELGYRDRLKWLEER
jgi:hypothetical protein